MATECASAFEDDEDKVDLTQEECWEVISSFFKNKGIVRQQLDSFDDFIERGLVEVMDESPIPVIRHSDFENDQEIIVRLIIYYYFFIKHFLKIIKLCY